MRPRELDFGFAARFAAERREIVGHPGTTQRSRLSHLISCAALWGMLEQAATSSIPSSKRRATQALVKMTPVQLHGRGPLSPMTASNTLRTRVVQRGEHRTGQLLRD